MFPISEESNAFVREYLSMIEFNLTEIWEILVFLQDFINFCRISTLLRRQNLGFNAEILENLTKQTNLFHISVNYILPKAFNFV